MKISFNFSILQTNVSILYGGIIMSGVARRTIRFLSANTILSC